MVVTKWSQQKVVWGTDIHIYKMYFFPNVTNKKNGVVSLMLINFVEFLLSFYVIIALKFVPRKNFR